MVFLISAYIVLYYLIELGWQKSVKRLLREFEVAVVSTEKPSTYAGLGRFARCTAKTYNTIFIIPHGKDA